MIGWLISSSIKIFSSGPMQLFFDLIPKIFFTHICFFNTGVLNELKSSDQKKCVLKIKFASIPILAFASLNVF